MLKQVNKNPLEQTAQSFMVAANAYAEQQRQLGLPVPFMTAANAREELKKVIKSVVAFADPSNKNHNLAYNALREQIGDRADRLPQDRAKSWEGAFNAVESFGTKYRESALGYAEGYAKRTGSNAEVAVEAAYNALAGNPVFDHFSNLNLLAGQQYQKMSGMETWLAEGDAMAVPTEAGGTGTDASRFRAPYEQVTGSAKRYQGDINPISHMRNDENRIKLNLFNEFKNAVTLQAAFSITQDDRNNALGYAKAVQPALAGFILQNRYFGASQQQVLKLAETWFWDGQDALANYIAGVGGSYGLLSPAVNFHLSDWDQATPTTAGSADFAANPNKLLQKIQNFYALPTSTAAQLSGDIDPSLFYKEIVRLVNMYAQQFVDFGGKGNLFVPTTMYQSLVAYPGTQSGGTGQGTFNKNLDEMVRTATNSVVKSVNIIPTPFMNYRASNSWGNTSQPYNYMLFTINGAPQESKPIIMPGLTAAPYVVSENVSAVIMNFYTQYLTGGPMFMQLGGAYLLEFSNPYP